MSGAPGGNALPQQRPGAAGDDDDDSYSYSYSASEPEVPPAAAKVDTSAPKPVPKKSQVYHDADDTAPGQPPQPAAATATAPGLSSQEHQSMRGREWSHPGDDEDGGADEEDKKGKKKKRGHKIAMGGGMGAMKNAIDRNPVVAFISGTDGQRLCVYFFFFFSFFYLLFTILSSTLSQLDEVGGGCYTYWGYKSSCGSISYTTRPSLMHTCMTVGRNLQAASAFSIFTILLAAGMCGCGWVLCIRLRKETRAHNRQRALLNETKNGGDNDDEEMEEFGGNGQSGNSGSSPHYRVLPFHAGALKWVCVGITAASIVCNLICWAIVASLFSARHCEDKNLPRTLTYGVGFGLSLTGWIFSLLLLVAFSIMV